MRQSTALSWLKSYGLVRLEKVIYELGEEGPDRMRDLVSLELAESRWAKNTIWFRYISLKGEK